MGLKIIGFENVLRDIIYDDGYIIIGSFDRRGRNYAVKFFRKKVGLFSSIFPTTFPAQWYIRCIVKYDVAENLKLYAYSYGIHSMTEIIYAMHEKQTHYSNCDESHLA